MNEGPAISPPMVDSRVREVMDFWFAPKGDPEHNKTRVAWFKKDDAFDAEIRDRFAALIEEALAGQLDHWREDPTSAVAQIVVLDQFPRNAFRGTARAFAGDALALSAAKSLVARRADRALPGVHRQFVYLPFEHAEDLAAQDECVRRFRALAADEPEHADLITWAERHRAIIARFGRFPHRNALLGRASTPEEEAFLREPGSSF